MKWSTILLIIFCILLLVIAVIIIVDEVTKPDEIPRVILMKKEVINRRHTDGKYQLLFAYKYSNGQTIKQWEEVDLNDYITLWEG